MPGKGTIADKKGYLSIGAGFNIFIEYPCSGDDCEYNKTDKIINENYVEEVSWKSMPTKHGEGLFCPDCLKKLNK